MKPKLDFIKDFEFLMDEKVCMWYGEKDEAILIPYPTPNWHFWSGKPERFLLEDDYFINIIMPGYQFKEKFYEVFEEYIEI